MGNKKMRRNILLLTLFIIFGLSLTINISPLKRILSKHKAEKRLAREEDQEEETEAEQEEDEKKICQRRRTGRRNRRRRRRRRRSRRSSRKRSGKKIKAKSHGNSPWRWR